MENQSPILFKVSHYFGVIILTLLFLTRGNDTSKTAGKILSESAACKL